MRSLSKVALGGGLASVLTVGGLVAGGVFVTTATLVVTDPLAPRASADSLKRFGDCQARVPGTSTTACARSGPTAGTAR
jgi:hypothetical protein